MNPNSCHSAEVRFTRAMTASGVQRGERIAILAEIKECLMPVAEAWALTAARRKGIPDGSPLEGEELKSVWGRITAAYPFFLQHAEQAGRPIPVVEVTPSPPAPEEKENLPSTFTV